jgi:hypothetical protein
MRSLMRFVKRTHCRYERDLQRVQDFMLSPQAYAAPMFDGNELRMLRLLVWTMMDG